MNIFRMTWYLISINFRDFGYWFWTLGYPLLMSGLFILATSNMTDSQPGDIKVGMEEGHAYGEILEPIDFINVSYLSEDEAVAEMSEDAMAGYIHNENDLLVTDSGFEQTILETVLNQIQQVGQSGVPYQNFDFDTQYVEMANQSAQPETVLFYALVSMMAFYGMFSIIEFISTMQPNLSSMGARFSASPFSKFKLLLSSIISSLGLNFFTNIFILLVIEVFYQVELFNHLWPTLFLIFIANLTGIGLGLIIGLIPKINANVKTIVAVVFIIALSFLAGLMGPVIKNIVDENLPVLTQINPLSRMTDTMYKINFLGNFNDYWMTVGILSLYAIIFYTIAFITLRRKRYDSI